MQRGISGTFILISIALVIAALSAVFYFGRPAIKTSPVWPKSSISPSPSDFKLQLPEAAALAKKDLAEKLKINESEISIVKTEEVNWTDSSLGCPKEGEVYLQVITPGYKVIFGTGQKQYEYHTDKGKTFAECSTNQIQAESLSCGGFTGELCPQGYQCKLEGDFPDAPGKCVKESLQ